VSHPVSLVSGWQDKLKELIFYASPAIGDDDVAAFIRPPQAAHETTGHPGKLSERSPLARGYRAPSPAALKEGRFEVVMHCKAPGFRSASKKRDTKPKCHAALRVEINSKDAKFATVTIMEPCVHRAWRMPTRGTRRLSDRVVLSAQTRSLSQQQQQQLMMQQRQQQQMRLQQQQLMQAQQQQQQHQQQTRSDTPVGDGGGEVNAEWGRRQSKGAKRLVHKDAVERLTKTKDAC